MDDSLSDVHPIQDVFESIPAVERVDLSRREFGARYYTTKRPVVVRRSAEDWGARSWTPDYLKSLLGTKEVKVWYNKQGIFSLADKPETGALERKSMTFGDAIDLIFSDDGACHYIMQQSMRKSFPELLGDVRRHYLLDRMKIPLQTNIWIGADGCKTPLHYDLSDNFLVQVLGTKKLTLFPPEASDGVYPSQDKGIEHTSRLNVFAPIDPVDYPLYQHAAGMAHEVVLNPGDVLYIPRSWWHAVETVEASVSVNVWWGAIDSWGEAQQLASTIGYAVKTRLLHRR